jgi:dTDP-4-amino-4,6-dideoxygalactose transaminase
MEWRIPLADIDFDSREEAAVLEVLKSRWLTMGAVTQAFEEEFSSYVGARHAIAVANGTAALHLACLGVDLEPGDEVIVPSLTFVATANAIRAGLCRY